MTPGLVSVLAVATALTTLPRADQAAPPVPFGVGERFTYDVKLGPFKAGRGSMEVTGMDTVRGRTAWRAVFRVKGGILGYKADNTMESWIDTATARCPPASLPRNRRRGRRRPRPARAAAGRRRACRR